LSVAGSGVPRGNATKIILFLTFEFPKYVRKSTQTVGVKLKQEALTSESFKIYIFERK
jgi:hypothetical protein